MGNAPTGTDDATAKTKRVNGGRVEISLLKNDLEQQLASTATPDQQQQPK